MSRRILDAALQLMHLCEQDDYFNSASDGVEEIAKHAWLRINPDPLSWARFSLERDCHWAWTDQYLHPEEQR